MNNIKKADMLSAFFHYHFFFFNILLDNIRLFVVIVNR